MSYALRNRLAFAIAAVAMTAGGVLRAETINVVLLAGQSNASGRADATELPASTFDAEIEFFYDTDVTGASTRTDSSGDFVQLAPPGSTFGPEMTLGRTLYHQGMRNLAIVKITRGGTNLRTDWEKGNDNGDQMYALFIETVSSALDTIRQRGDSANLLGMVWHQGEGDAGHEANNPGSYQANLTQFIADVRSDLAAPTLPFVIGGVLEAGREPLYTAQRSTAEAVPHTAFVGSAQTEAFDVTTHFDGKSQRWMGARFAHALTPREDYLEFEPPNLEVGGIDGQAGWRAPASLESLVVSTGASGSYVAGQAMGHVDAGGAEHLGTLAATPVFGKSMSADFFAGDATDHDLDGTSDYDEDQLSDSTVRLFGWIADHNEDGFFSGGGNDLRSVGFGLDNDGTIGIKTADGVELSTGVGYGVDKWYRLTLTWSEPDGEGDRLVRLFAYDLTEEDEVNQGEPIFSSSLAAEQFGADPSTWIGTGVRATRGLIDNIHHSQRDDILVGDYNEDGRVGPADYTLWRDALSRGGALANDASAGVARDDYARWTMAYGSKSANEATGYEIPEPLSLSLLLAAFLATYVR